MRVAPSEEQAPRGGVGHDEVHTEYRKRVTSDSGEEARGGGSRSEVSPVSLIKTCLVRTIQERRAAGDVVVLLKAGSSGCLTGGGRYGGILFEKA